MKFSGKKTWNFAKHLFWGKQFSNFLSCAWRKNARGFLIFVRRRIFSIDFSVECGFFSTNNLSTYLKLFVFMRRLSSKALTFKESWLTHCLGVEIFNVFGRFGVIKIMIFLSLFFPARFWAGERMFRYYFSYTDERGLSLLNYKIKQLN